MRKRGDKQECGRGDEEERWREERQGGKKQSVGKGGGSRGRARKSEVGIGGDGERGGGVSRTEVHMKGR